MLTVKPSNLTRPSLPLDRNCLDLSAVAVPVAERPSASIVFDLFGDARTGLE